MNVIKKLILRDLKLNKKRTIVTIIGIILSTAMICAVAGMVTSLQKTLVTYIKIKEGNYHTMFCNVPKNELKYIENNINIKDYYLAEEIGYSELKESKNEYKPYLNIISANDKYLKNMGIQLVDGRLPENDSEVLISEHIKSNGHVEYKIGEKLILNIGKRVDSNGRELSQLDSFDPTIKEKLQDTYQKKYKIVGIIERTSYQVEPRSAPGYTIISKMNEVNNKADIAVLYKNVYKYEELNKEISNGKYEIVTNNSLLSYEGASLNDSQMTTVMQLAGIIIMIIIVSSVFVIRNSFAISTTERMKQYGMLVSVGATHKQVKKSVFFEGFILGLIGIPLGVLSGMLADIVLLNVVTYILKDLLYGVKLMYSIPLIAIIASIILASITILFSTRSSARKAAKVSPMELIRSNQDIKIKPKKMKSPKLINKIWGIGGDISYKNLKRNKKKYRTTIISIIVSIVIFISLYSFIENGFKASNIYYTKYSYNINLSLHCKDNSQNLENRNDILKQISKFNTVKKYSILNDTQFNVSTKYLSDFGKDLYNEYNPYADVASIEVISIGEDAYKNYVRSLGGKVEEYSKGGILVDDFNYFKDEKYQLGNIYNIKVGESFEGKSNEKDWNIRVVNRTDKRPMGLEKVYNDGGFLIVSDSFMDEIGVGSNYSRMYIESSNSSKLEDDINNFIADNDDLKSNLTIYNVDKETKAQNSLVLVISIFLYGFIAVITLIGVTNIFNTLTTTMNLRRKEFAMLKSIGMTTKEFNRMIRLESIFYGLKALIIGIPIGIGLSYLIYKAFLNTMDMPYVLPIEAIVISIIFVLIVVGVIMKFSLNKINKQNIIETIREDNI